MARKKLHQRRRGSRIGDLKKEHADAVEYYLRGMTKQEALIKAGYSEATAAKAAWRIFGREDVQRAIDERRFRMRSRTHEMTDRIKEELSRIAFFNIGELLEITSDGQLVFNFDTVTMEDLAAVGEVTVEEFVAGKDAVRRVKVKPWNKHEALVALGRIHGMFNDRLEVTAQAESIEDRLVKGRERIRRGITMEGEAEEVRE